MSKENKQQRVEWCFFDIKKEALLWLQKTKKQVGLSEENPSWWAFLKLFRTGTIDHHLRAFLEGNHQFSPMKFFSFSDEGIQIWGYVDRLMVHLLNCILRPNFKHIIPYACASQRGPTAIKDVSQEIEIALHRDVYSHVLRVDIKGYYGAIDHNILLAQLRQHFDDPKVLKYLEDIITIAVDKGGNITLPKKGIPRRSSVSPFFGSLYLAALDTAFDDMEDVFYRRYGDDIIVLVKNARQYRKVKKRLFSILRSLQLQISPHKTLMGRLKKFHFLGIDFECKVSRNLEGKNQVTVTMHKRSCRRALDKVQAMKDNAVHPAKIQRYLGRWATWWHSIADWDWRTLIEDWVDYTQENQPALTWLGSGLILVRGISGESCSDTVSMVNELS